MAAKRHHGGMIRSGYYEGEEPRRRQEMMDGNMIHEDHSAPANLPQEVMMKYWPREEGYIPERLDDSITGIDEQEGADNRKKNQHMVPHKY